MSNAACAKEIICLEKAKAELYSMVDTLNELSVVIGDLKFSTEAAELCIDAVGKARQIMMEKAANLQG